MSAHDEGHTVAGWTGCAVATIGTAVIGVGVCGWRPGIWLGLALTVAAVLVTWVLHLAGWGKPPGVRPAGQHPLGVRDQSARQGHPGCVACRLAGRRAAWAREATATVPTPETAAAGADVSS
ncbi:MULTISPECIES: HGxxPAAW family protein [unclassified Streptomyces]|uniref:HGxxPAAW family protein n=1 Tax=unclassified Streptomyces TaxID=2593676 RepID=UPI0029665244|nr:HGxxPAAW family protein [Streptomyces sp. SCL15-4]